MTTEIVDPLNINLGSLTLTATGIESSLASPPTVDQFRGALQFIGRANGAMKWWIGDLANHADQWGDEYVQLLDELGEQYTNIRQWAWCCKKVVRRITDVDFSHHYAVAGLEPERQVELLEWCRPDEQGKAPSVAELKKRIKGESAPAFNKQAELEKVGEAVERIAERWPESELEELGQKLIECGEFYKGVTA